MSYGPSRNSRGAGNPGSQPVTFTLADAKRIGDAVRQVETGRRGRTGSSLPRATGGGAGVQQATFAGTWWKGTDKTVTLWIAGGSETATAYNYLANIASMPGPPRKCYVVNVEGTLSLVAAECV